MRAFLAVLLVLAFAGCRAETPREPALHVWIACVGKSMLPNFPESCLLEVDVNFPYDELKAGDTVVIRTAGNPPFVHHRLVTKRGEGWIVKGDNPETNPVVDEFWLTRETYEGRATGRYTMILLAPVLQ